MSMPHVLGIDIKLHPAIPTLLSPLGRSLVFRCNLAQLRYIGINADDSMVVWDNT